MVRYMPFNKRRTKALISVAITGMSLSRDKHNEQSGCCIGVIKVFDNVRALKHSHLLIGVLHGNTALHLPPY